MILFRFFVLCLIFITVVEPVNSQVTVTLSTTKVTMDGKTFLLHIVQPGETLFSISRAYNVSQYYIVLNNPGVQSGVRAGAEIRIPIEDDEAPTNATDEDPEQFIRHITEQGQTIYWLTRNYNITEEELYRYNPELASSPLQAGQLVRIPRRAPVSDIVDTAPQSVETDSIRECVETSKNEFRIAMLLPLFLNDNFPSSAPDSAITRDAGGGFRYRSGRFWISSRSTNAIEFYQGAMLAVDSLKKQGLNAKIDVYDTMRDTERVTQILNNPEIKNADLIVGPFVTELVEHVANFSRENGIYFVSPAAVMSVANNPYMIQVNSGEINTVATMVNHITGRENIHVTLIGNTDEADQTLFNAYLNRFNAAYGEDGFTTLRMSANNLQLPIRYLRRGMMNVVVIPSSSEAFVNIVTGQLNAQSNSFQINVYGLAAWTKFVNLDLEYLHKLEFRYASAFFIDYEKPAVRDFLKKFRTIYNTEPTMVTGFGGISPFPYLFTFLGYDVTYFFVSALKKYGENLGNCLPDFQMEMPQSNFRFERLDNQSGYRNTHFDIYWYTRDYTILITE